MSLTSKHPLYQERAGEWEQMRDTFEGERRVKERRQVYLPATSGMLEDGALTDNANSKGRKDYDSYVKRAVFHEIVSISVELLLGVMHSKPATIELPGPMEYLLETASPRGESLEQLLQRINEEQLVTGRLGLLADVIDRGKRSGEHYIALYQTEDITNWDQGERTAAEIEALNMVVLDESTYRREGLDWQMVNQYRLLVLGDLSGEAARTGDEGMVYRTAVFHEDTVLSDVDGRLEAPTYRGRTLDHLPFTFVNAVDVATEPAKPPLIGLSNLTLAAYRGEADYRQALFMQGQDTLVVSGMPDDDEPIRLGVGAVIRIPTPVGKAEFVGVDSQGLPEQGKAIERDLSRAEQFALRLMDSTTRERESGDALRIRVATRTVTLNRIAKAGAYGLQRILRSIASWMDLNPEDVTVTPNLDFVDDTMSGDQLRMLLEAREKGAPLSIRSIHEIMAKRSMTDLSYEQELDQIREESEVLSLLRQSRIDPDAGGSAGRSSNNDNIGDPDSSPRARGNPAAGGGDPDDQRPTDG